VLSDLGASEEAENLRKSVLKHCVKTYNGKRVFAWSVDIDGNWDVYDEPPGSLQLLPSLGFCADDDEVWLNTVELIRSPEYAYSFSGKPFADIGCPHAPHPWLLSVANGLLCGRVDEGADFLKRAAMDNGIACESVDEVTGICATGAAFATCAGFLAYAMWTALSETLPTEGQ
jgi:meiotically up-regulated gene 157 (Mug157) protein